MHPDQFTPDSHRYTAPDSEHEAENPRPPEVSQQAEEDLEATSETVLTPDPDGARLAEAGSEYVGRQMDDRLKAHPRVNDGDEAVDQDPTTRADD